MTQRETSYLIFFGFLIGVAVVSAWIAWSKPTCRDGYVPIGGVFNGWVCVSGYKPQNSN